MVRQQQHVAAYLFGAVCPRHDEAIGLVTPCANTYTMQQHLDLVSERVPAGRHAVMVLDQAGWHTTPKLTPLANLSLLFLPPRSPELNPTEQVWAQLRTRYLANRCFKGYDDIVESSCEAWNAFVSEKGAIQKLCSRTWTNLKL